MTREQIIEIINSGWTDMCGWRGDAEKMADAILALPLDVPSDEEVMKESLNGHIILSDPKWMSWFNDEEQDIFIQGAKWMRDEIIKRNK